MRKIKLIQMEMLSFAVLFAYAASLWSKALLNENFKFSQRKKFSFYEIEFKKFEFLAEKLI